MEQRKMTGSASFRSSPKKTLYQHWRQFTPQFIGGAINRLVWGFCNRYSPQLLWGCLHPALPILFPIAPHPILLPNIVSRSRSRMLGEETRDWKLVKLNFWLRTQLPLINNRHIYKEGWASWASLTVRITEVRIRKETVSWVRFCNLRLFTRPWIS